MSVYKSYDIRGVYPVELDEDVVYRAGFAFAKFTRAKKIVIGRDNRLSSPKLCKALVKGVQAYGTGVIDIGICTTPLLYFSTKDYPGIMITASHNPKQYNGLKFCRKGRLPLGYDSGLKIVEDMSKKTIKPLKTKGKYQKKSFLNEYLKHLLDLAKNIDPTLRIVIDASHGTGGVVLEPLLKKLKCRHVTKLYFKQDGKFPDHTPNPMIESATKRLQQEVKKKKAALGIALDGDADRVLFIDERGKRVRSDHALIILAKHILKKKKGAVIYDLRSSWTVREEIKRSKGESFITKVGHTHVSDMMKENRALLGGEISGHFYFKDTFYVDNADYAILLMLSAVSMNDFTLSEMVRSINRYHYSGEINFKTEEKEQAITTIYNHVREKFKGAKIQFLDGLSVELKDWWFNIRPSNTEPVLRLVVEARDKKMLDKRVKLLAKLVKGRSR